MKTSSNGLPGDATDDHARFMSATVSTDGAAVRVACLYLPNGNPVNTEKYHIQNQMDGSAFSLLP